MPIGISSKRPRAATLASRSRGYHASGVAILRPSASVTTSSSAVKATETGLISPTSISKVLMPFAFEDIALRSQVTDNSADFMGRKSRIHRDREIVQPELGFEISGSDMDMRRLAAFIRIEERAIGSPAQDGRHSILVPSFCDKPLTAGRSDCLASRACQDGCLRLARLG